MKYKETVLEYIPTADMKANIMTKALDRIKHIKFSISLRFLTSTGLRGGVEGVIPVEENRDNMSTNAETMAPQHVVSECKNKNKNAPEDWSIPVKRRQ